MKKITLVALVLAALPSAAFAQNVVRHANLEPACSASGSGMDPRCVGDTFPGTLSDALSTRQERALEGRAMTQTYRAQR